MIPRLAFVLVALVLGSCSSMQRELSDDEWCKSFEYRAGTRECADCRQRTRPAASPSSRSKIRFACVQIVSPDVDDAKRLLPKNSPMAIQSVGFKSLTH